MWIERYRPQAFEQVMGLDPELPKLINEDMPHLMFCGKAGSGKTTTARIIVNVLGADCLRLNASDERGIDVIRDKVKDYARTRSSNGKFKIVFLDEADYLTPEAMMILRGVIEAYHSNCRFILTGNYENKFTDPLKSRCKRFNFNTQSPEQIASKYLNKICDEEKILIEADALRKLAAKYTPDIRTMVNELETLAKKGVNITPDMINENDERIEELVQLLQKGQITKAKKWILDSPYDIHTLLNLLTAYSWNASWDKHKKLKFWVAIGENSFRMAPNNCVDIETQIPAGLVRMYRALL